MKLKEVITYLQEKIEEGVIDENYELNNENDESYFTKYQWTDSELEDFQEYFGSKPIDKISNIIVMLDLRSNEYNKFLEEEYERL